MVGFARTVAKKQLPAAVRAYLAKIGARGGKRASGAGGRARWADVPADARSKRMRDLVRKRWAKAKRTKRRELARKGARARLR